MNDFFKYFEYSERKFDILSNITIAIAFITLYASELYGAMLFLTLFIAFYVIVALNKKYDYLKQFAERFFGIS